MAFEIHPSAENNFNQKAQELVKLIKKFPTASKETDTFQSDRHIAATLTEKDIIGEPDTTSADYLGRTIERFFYVNREKFGFDKASYKSVIKIAESLKSLPAFRCKVSQSFIEKTLCDWARSALQSENELEPFIEYLQREVNSKVKKTTAWVPVANLEVEASFSISKSEIRPFSKEIINGWIAKATPEDGEIKEEIKEYFERVREDCQGLAAIVMEIEAEPEYAFEYATEEAEQVTSILGIFSHATLLPDVKCVSRIKGSERVAQAQVFFESAQGQCSSSKVAIIDRGVIHNWRISQNMISEIKQIGLDNLSRLFAAKDLNSFQESVLNSALLYSKSAFTADPVEKIVYILSSLESVLLKNENEPIQQNLAERIAVFTERELTKRKAIIKTIKAVYGIRSKYLHHGHTSSELELITEFMRYVWVFFWHMVENADQFNSKEDFISAIDDHKLA